VDIESRKSVTMTFAAAIVVTPSPVATTYWNARRESALPATPDVAALYGAKSSCGIATCFSRRWSVERERERARGEWVRVREREKTTHFPPKRGRA
jgi:hypothetical protein